MDAAARVGDRDVVAGRGDLIREGRGREGGRGARRYRLQSTASGISTSSNGSARIRSSPS